MTAWHEFGEWTALALGAIGLTEARLTWLLTTCQCEERRAWLNETGEAWWIWWNPTSFISAKSRFAWTVLALVDHGVEPESVLYDEICAVVPMSKRCFNRWMLRLEDANMVAHVDTWRGGPVRLYGLPSRRGR
jgi:hypothetical protein